MITDHPQVWPSVFFGAELTIRALFIFARLGYCQPPGVGTITSSNPLHHTLVARDINEPRGWADHNGHPCRFRAVAVI